MTAQASFDLAKLPEALREPQEIIDTAEPCPALAEANNFEEGQISGPFGPKFVGFGPMEKVQASLAVTFGMAGLIAAVSGIVIALRG